jgi:hypothetical protein
VRSPTLYFIFFAIASLFVTPGNTATQNVIGLRGAAAPAIVAEIRKEGFAHPVKADVFYGDTHRERDE